MCEWICQEKGDKVKFTRWVWGIGEGKGLVRAVWFT